MMCRFFVPFIYAERSYNVCAGIVPHLPLCYKSLRYFKGFL